MGWPGEAGVEGFVEEDEKEWEWEMVVVVVG